MAQALGVFSALRQGLVAPGLVLLLLAPLVALAQAKGIVVRDDRDQRVFLMATPQRVVSLVPSLTETVCELRACERLVGVDNFSNWPASIQSLPRLGGLEDTQIEKIAQLKPDLILAAVSSRAVKRLEGLGFTVLALEPHDFTSFKRSVHTLALALGDTGAGHELITRMEKRIAAAAAQVPQAWRGSSVYFEVSSAPYAAGEASFVGELLAQLSLRNVVPKALGPFPQISPEYILRREPKVVMASAKELGAMAQRPGFERLPALRQGAGCGFSTAAWDSLVRPGPRLADGAEAIVQCLSKLPVAKVVLLPSAVAARVASQHGSGAAGMSKAGTSAP